MAEVKEAHNVDVEVIVRRGEQERKRTKQFLCMKVRESHAILSLFSCYVQVGTVDKVSS